MSDNAPEYGGKCATAVSLRGTDKAPAGKAKYAVERDGKTYYFAGALPKLMFQMIPGLAARAEKKATV